MSSKIRKKSRADFIFAAFENFRRSLPEGTPVDADLLFNWAKREGYDLPPPKTELQLFKEELRKCLNKRTYVDPQGRTVKFNHAVVLKSKEGQQKTRWGDVDSPPQHMQVSVQQGKRSLLGGGKQLRTTVQSYNENNKYGATIFLSLNLDEELDEMELPTEFQDKPPEDEESEKA